MVFVGILPNHGQLYIIRGVNKKTARQLLVHLPPLRLANEVKDGCVKCNVIQNTSFYSITGFTFDLLGVLSNWMKKSKKKQTHF